MGKKAVIILADGFEETEAVTTIDIVKRGGIDVEIAGLSATTAIGAHGITISCDTILEALSGEYNAVILPGGQPGTKNLAASEAVSHLVKEFFSQGKLCAAICAAPTVFAKTGILEGKAATCYPGCESDLPEGSFCEDAVVVDGNVITSRGVGTAIDFSLAIISYLENTAVAENVAEKILYQK